MNRLEDKILQYIISGKAAEDDAIDKEIREDPSFDLDDFELLEKIWAGSDQLQEYRRAPQAAAWQNIVRDAGLERERRKIGTSRPWLIAASMIGLVVLGSYFLLRSPYVTYTAVAAEEYILPDNTMVNLQEGTTIRYLKPREFVQAPVRDVYLEGVATFSVTPDAAKPFSVITDLTSVNVLGTRFIYQARGNYSASENLEGQVRFATNDGANEVILNPGDKASFDGTTMEVERFEPPPPSPQPIIEPTNNITIADLIDILGYRYEVQLELTSTVVPSNVVVPVNLSITDLDRFITALEENPLVAIEAERTSFGYRITTLTGSPSGLTADYNFQMFEAGIPPRQ